MPRVIARLELWRSRNLPLSCEIADEVRLGLKSVEPSKFNRNRIISLTFSMLALVLMLLMGLVLYLVFKRRGWL